MPITWLYVPGDRPERFGKACASGADVVILDLEDAVDAVNKDRARDAVTEYLTDRRTGPRLHVRVNDVATDRGCADLAALADLRGLDAVRLPKIESPGDLAAVDAAFGARDLGAYALLESALGVANLHAVAAHPRVSGIALGEQDLATALSLSSEAAFDHLRLQAVLAAAAAGLGPVAMSVHPHVRDDEGLRASCLHGRGLGMLGRSAIHPRQIPVIRAAFRPSSQEVERAGEIVRTAERSERDGRGAWVLPDGSFVDLPIVARARTTLALAERLAD
ncbi:CoA ester lyase [Prauserella sp. ASG 168]|uniref:CoA ester lyase n=1 Tax=Prauserella cavernicola TaxID=2800127 RepID=A0A934QMP1_9PSEU|nr:CoA ester lyase [Prauserella cavernicola]